MLLCTYQVWGKRNVTRRPNEIRTNFLYSGRTIAFEFWLFGLFGPFPHSLNYQLCKVRVLVRFKIFWNHKSGRPIRECKEFNVERKQIDCPPELSLLSIIDCWIQLFIFFNIFRLGLQKKKKNWFRRTFLCFVCELNAFR